MKKEANFIHTATLSKQTRMDSAEKKTSKHVIKKQIQWKKKHIK